MAFSSPPKIIGTEPRNNSIDISTALKQIVVRFSTDLNPQYIDGNFQLQERNGMPLKLSASYDNQYRQIVVTILEEEALKPNTNYTFTVFGDMDLSDNDDVGIRSVMGAFLQGTISISFTTNKEVQLVAPIGVNPKNKSQVKEPPVFKWKEVVGAIQYELELSGSNNLQPVHWSTKVSEEEVQSTFDLDDGVHYWHVRAITEESGTSEWSPIYTFNLDTQVEAPTSPEDTVPDEEETSAPTPEEGAYYEVESSYPREGFSNVKENLQSITFQVLGEVKEEDIDFEMVGENVLGDEDDHGVVKGTMTIEYAGGISTVTFTPELL